MVVAGPLAGLRVVDVCDDAGRFATKLLAEAGASVGRVAAGNEAGREMADAAMRGRGGLLDWWYDGGKEAAPLQLDVPADRERYRKLAARADLVVDTVAPGRLA